MWGSICSCGFRVKYLAEINHQQKNHLSWCRSLCRSPRAVPRRLRTRQTKGPLTLFRRTLTLPPSGSLTNRLGCNIAHRLRLPGPSSVPVLRLHTVYGMFRYNKVTTNALKNSIFWDVTPCGSCKNRVSEGLLNQGDKNWWTRNNASWNYQPTHAAKKYQCYFFAACIGW
jgi:hypothetical protein